MYVWAPCQEHSSVYTQIGTIGFVFWTVTAAGCYASPFSLLSLLLLPGYSCTNYLRLANNLNLYLLFPIISENMLAEG